MFLILLSNTVKFAAIHTLALNLVQIAFTYLWNPVNGHFAINHVGKFMVLEKRFTYTITYYVLTCICIHNYVNNQIILHVNEHQSTAL